MAPTFGVSGARVDLAGGDKHEADLGAALVPLSFFSGFFWTFSDCGGAIEVFFLCFFGLFPIVGVPLSFFLGFFLDFCRYLQGGAVEFFLGSFWTFLIVGVLLSFFSWVDFFQLWGCHRAVVFSWVSFWTFSD
jgi:hypothetical protein